MRLSRRVAVVLTAALLAPALPSVAASPLTVVTPLVSSAALAAGATLAPLTDEQLVGVTWASGDPQVAVRWQTPTGWTAWEVPEDDSDAADEPGTRGGTEPLWRPTDAVAVDLRVAGEATDLTLVRVSDGTATTRWTWGTPEAAADGPLGRVRSRAEWGADESIRRGTASAASSVKAVVVHHTAGGNDYSPADVPKKIRADYAYHVKARGWSDLGYNLVVDKFGGIWEGRAGGLGRATIGSHSGGFNTGTLGVSLLGDMTKTTPTAEAVRAMSRVGAYAAATWSFDPTSSVTLTSGGGTRYPSGTKVTLPRIFGHRDVGKTACPGTLYDRLGTVRAEAKALLGPAPQLTGVTVAGAPVQLPVPLVVTGTISRSSPWQAALRNAAGEIVLQTAGEGTTATLTWNGLLPLAPGGPAVVPALPGRYTWAVRVDNGVHPFVRQQGDVDVVLPVLPSG